MICSLETYVLDVVGGSREGKPTSSEGAGVRGELWQMLWLTFWKPCGVKGIARVNSFGRVYGQRKSHDDGSDLSIPRHLFFMDLSFHVVLKEQMIGPAKLDSN